MTEREARQMAARKALKYKREYYVVWSPEDHDVPRQHYHVSNEDDLDGFYQGAPVVAVMEP